MQKYRVMIEVDVEADSPQDAGKKVSTLLKEGDHTGTWLAFAHDHPEVLYAVSPPTDGVAVGKPLPKSTDDLNTIL